MATEKRDPNAEELPNSSDELDRKTLARNALRPTVRNAISIRKLSGEFGKLDLTYLITELRAQAQAASSGDLGRAEAMLIAQAHTLDALFNSLLRRAMDQDMLPQFEAHMRYALRAQNQARATLETLAAIKNPPIVYARQANIAQQQQVNNGIVQPLHTGAHARHNESEHSKLSDSLDELLPNAGTSPLAGAVNPTVEAVGKVDRT